MYLGLEVIQKSIYLFYKNFLSHYLEWFLDYNRQTTSHINGRKEYIVKENTSFICLHDIQYQTSSNLKLILNNIL